jgi:hypothetical protein
VQAFARRHYGWRGDDNDHVNQDTEGILSTAQTPPNQKTQSMVVTPSPSRVEVQCPICFVNIYSCKDRSALPLTADGIADWYQCWSKGTKNPLRAARDHFKEEHKDIKTPCGIRSKNKKRDIAKLSNGKADKKTYARLRREEIKLARLRCEEIKLKRTLQMDTPT